MINVLLLTSSYPSDSDVVSRTFMSDFTSSIASELIHFYVVCPHRHGLPYQETKEHITIIRFPYWFSSSGQRISSGAGIAASVNSNPLVLLQMIPFCICQFLVALRIIRDNEIHLIHSHWIIPQGFIGALLRLITRIPHVNSIHGTDIHLIHANRFLFSVLSLFSRCIDCFTTNSSYTFRLLQDILSGQKVRSLIIPMGISPYEYPDRKLTNSLRKNQVLFVGRLIALKGVRILISSMKRVIEKYPDSCLVIIGDGPDRSSLEELCFRKKMSQNIRFIGGADKKTLFSYYQNSAIFVLPSIMLYNGQTEGLGVVLLEAMASGLPVIGSNVGGIPDIISHEVNGLLVSPGDPDALADAIIRILTDPDLASQISEEGRKTVLAKFSWSVIADRFIGVYYDCIKKTGKKVLGNCR